MKTVRRVWISEDATAITAKVNYDPSTDQLVGITLPIDSKTGCPIVLNYEARDEAAIREHLKHPKSKFVYLVMAQPLDEKVPPFILQIFGTNSEFKTIDVIHRWKVMQTELQK